MIHIPSIYDVFEASIPVAVQSLFAAIVLLLIIGYLIRRGASSEAVIPSERFTLRNILEVLMEGVASLARDTIGPKWATYMPLVGTLGFFILVSNLMGLVPGLGGPTSFLETNLAWAVIAFVVSEVAGFIEHGWGYFKHFAPGPWWILPLLTPIEIVSHLVRVMSLTVRLTANMLADHTLVGMFLSFPIIQAFIPWTVMGLGLFVAFVQAFIFTFLTMIYIGLALEEAH